MIDIESMKKLEQLKNTIFEYQFDNDEDNKKKELVLVALSLLSGEAFDDYSVICTYSMKQVLPQLINANLTQDNRRNLDEVLVRVAMFVKEKYIRTGTLLDAEFKILSFYEKSNLSERETYFKIKLGAFNIYQVENFNAEYDGKMAAFTNVYNNYYKELEEWKSKVEFLKQELAKQTTEYNYLNLSKAFLGLLGIKIAELKSVKRYLGWFGVFVIVVPLIVVIVNVWLKINLIEIKAEDLVRIVPVAVIELMLIYYFRINLKQYYSIKAQMLQIQYRNSLCAFIENHTYFKNQHKDIDFEKFDTLIYSPIMPQAEQIPSTFDGLEQVAKLVNAIKGGGGKKD